MDLVFEIGNNSVQNCQEHLLIGLNALSHFVFQQVSVDKDKFFVFNWISVHFGQNKQQQQINDRKRDSVNKFSFESCATSIEFSSRHKLHPQTSYKTNEIH